MAILRLSISHYIIQTNIFTCADHHSLDQFTRVEAGLDDIGATEQCVSFMVLCVVDTVGLPRLVWQWVWEVGLCDGNAFTWLKKKGEIFFRVFLIHVN